MTIVAIHQPYFLPWFGYFAKIKQADIFVYYDDVQMSLRHKENYRNRVKIKAANEQGWKWLTVPVHCPFGTLIKDVCPVAGWREKMIGALLGVYGRSAHYDAVMEIVEFPRCGTIADICINGTQALVETLGLSAEFVLSSAISPKSNERNQRLVDVVAAVGGDTYLCGSYAAGYIDLELFKAHGIQVVFNDFEMPVYPHLSGSRFIRGLSVVDAMFSVGPEKYKEMFHNARTGYRRTP